MEYILHTTSTDLETYDDTIELEPLQKAVGGIIEVIHLIKCIMIVNQEGLILNLPINPVASNIAGYPIVGDVVVLTAESMEEFIRG